MNPLNPFKKSKYPFCYSGHEYALRVVSGEEPNCKYIIGACQRYLDDLENQDTRHYFFNPDKAEKFLRLAQRFDHVIGEWDTSKIVYEPWQCWVFMNIMGFIDRRTGYRRFRIAHIEVPRGNGKSPLASIVGLYMLSLDNPVGNQISCVATKKDQARIVLDSARNMAKKNKSFLKSTGVRVLAHTIVHDKSDSIMRALSSDSNKMDGLTDVLAIMDELHAMSRETFEVIYSGMSKRKDSLTLCITTAGFDMDSVGYSQSCYAKKISLREHQDEQFFAAVYTIDEEDLKDGGIFKLETWKKANPNWGVSVDPITFEAKAKKAKVTPNDIPNLKVKHLNVWLSEMKAYFDLNAWDNCADKNLKIEDFEKHYCKLGIDLASTRDITSTAVIFKKDGKYYGFDRSYIPEDRVNEVRSVQYDKSIELGELIKTPGTSINNEFIRSDVKSIRDKYRITECAYDPWNAKEMSMNLEADRIQMVKFAMNTANLSEPMKKLDSLIREGNFIHNGSSLLRWCLGNVVAKEDANGNVFPRKTHEDFKIDPIVAMLMSLALWLQDETKESVYESRGVLVL